MGMMKHRVIIPKFEAFDKNWLINNFNCPVVPLSYSELMVCAGRITHSKFNLYSLSTSDGVSYRYIFHFYLYGSCWTPHHP